LGWGSSPSGTLRFKKIDGSFWNGETFRFADYTGNPSSKQHTKIKGILIKPKFRKPNKRKVLFGIIGVVVVAIIAAAASFFLLWGKA
jgi:hypothetical protein